MVEVKSFSGTQLVADIHLVRARPHWKDMIHVDVDISSATAQKHELITFPSSIGAGVSIMNGGSTKLLWNATRGRYTFS